MDAISISALIISIISSAGHFVETTHLKKCSFCFCVNSDCIDENKKRNSRSKLTPPETPIKTEPKISLEKIEYDRIKTILDIIDKNDNTITTEI